MIRAKFEKFETPVYSLEPGDVVRLDEGIILVGSVEYSLEIDRIVVSEHGTGERHFFPRAAVVLMVGAVEVSS